MMCNYSVIIPHYNSPEFLLRCLRSIPIREDIQVIVVDDCSSEQGRIRTLAKSFPHVEMIFLERNSGAGVARNTALSRAIGRWLVFADADDFFLPEAWTKFDKYVFSEYDIIYFMSESIDAVTLAPVDRSLTYNILVEACDNISKDGIDRLRLRHDVPWGKMIKHSLVKLGNVTFDEVRYCNDTMFSTRIGLLASRIYAAHIPVYCVTYNLESMIHQRSPQKDLVRYEVMLRKNKLLSDSGYGQWKVPIVAYFKSILLSRDLKAVKVFFNLGHVYKVHYMLELYYWIARHIKQIFNGKKTNLINV